MSEQECPNCHAILVIIHNDSVKISDKHYLDSNGQPIGNVYEARAKNILIDYMSVSLRARNILNDMCPRIPSGGWTIYSICQHASDDYFKKRGVGRRTLAEISKLVESYGYHLGVFWSTKS